MYVVWWTDILEFITRTSEMLMEVCQPEQKAADNHLILSTLSCSLYEANITIVTISPQRGECAPAESVLSLSGSQSGHSNKDTWQNWYFVVGVLIWASWWSLHCCKVGEYNASTGSIKFRMFHIDNNKCGIYNLHKTLTSVFVCLSLSMSISLCLSNRLPAYEFADVSTITSSMLELDMWQMPCSGVTEMS